MKKLIINFLLLLPQIIFCQEIESFFINKGEVNFSFEYKSKNQLNRLSKIISIDHKTNSKKAYAYANKKEFEQFLEHNIPFEIINKEPQIYNNK